MNASRGPLLAVRDLVQEFEVRNIKSSHPVAPAPTREASIRSQRDSRFVLSDLTREALAMNEDDERSIATLRRVREAIPERGKLLIVELVLPEGNEPFLGKWLDLHMLVLLGG